jgi:malate permease and related proteins
MELIFIKVVEVILPVLLCVGVGFLLAKIHQPFEKAMVGPLLSNVGYPALVISRLSNESIKFSDFLNTLLAALCVMVSFALISFVFLKLVRLPVRAYLTPMMFSNVGNIGIPIAMLAFGPQGVDGALAFVIVTLLGTFSVGIWLPRGRVTFKSILGSPLIYSFAIAMILMGTGRSLPRPIKAAVDILGGLAIPLMLLTLGHMLTTLKLGMMKRGLGIALFHLVMALAVAFLLDQLFGFKGVEHDVFVVMTVMPVSVAAFLFVDVYQPKESAGVAGFVLSSMLLAVVVLPVVLAFWAKPMNPSR